MTITKAQAEALDIILHDPELLKRAKAAIQAGQAKAAKPAPAKPGSTYDRLSKLSAGQVAATTKAAAARPSFHGQAAYDRLRTMSSAMANGTLRLKAASTTSSYEQALLDEIDTNNQVKASSEALNASIDAAQTASVRRQQLKAILLNSGEADAVYEVEDKYWEELAASQDENATPPVGKIARKAFGF